VGVALELVLRVVLPVMLLIVLPVVLRVVLLIVLPVVLRVVLRRSSKTAGVGGIVVVMSMSPLCADALAQGPGRQTPFVETRFDMGVGRVAMPMKPTYEEGRLREPTLIGSRAEYSALFARTRWLLPFEADAFTVAGGFSLALWPGNETLSLGPMRGPEGRYLSQYAFHTRLEFGVGSFVTAAGLSMHVARMDYVELALESIEPQIEFEARGTLVDFSIVLDELTPEIQLAGRAAPAGARWRVRSIDKVRPEGDSKDPFVAAREGGLSSYGAEAALGVRYTPAASSRRRQPREGVLVLGALYETRSFRGFVKKQGLGGTGTSDETGSALAVFLCLQGALP
jgi:hypothetical protein